MEKQEKQKELLVNELVFLDKKIDSLESVIKLEKEILTTIEENPFIEIVDAKTYEIAKKRRTALKKCKTGPENQEKIIATKIASFRKLIGTTIERLVSISLPAYNKQQEEIDRYEKEQKEKREREEREEAERVLRIENKLNELEDNALASIQKLTFENFEANTIINEMDVDFDFMEFSLKLDILRNRIENQLHLKHKELLEKENARLEKERLEREKEEADKKLKEQEEAHANALKKQQEEAEKKQAEILKQSQEAAEKLKQESLKAVESANNLAETFFNFKKTILENKGFKFDGEKFIDEFGECLSKDDVLASDNLDELIENAKSVVRVDSEIETEYFSDLEKIEVKAHEEVAIENRVVEINYKEKEVAPINSSKKSLLDEKNDFKKFVDVFFTLDDFSFDNNEIDSAFQFMKIKVGELRKEVLNRLELIKE